jgi:cation diffusion facilitator family transporter
MARETGSVKAVWYAFGANFSIFVAKGVAAAITGSGAMLAECVHSLADCGNQLLLLYGMRRSRQPASADAPLGHGKAIYFWSFVVALLLFSMGGLFSLYQGWHKLGHPEPVHSPWLAVAVLVFSAVAEGTALRNCIQLIDRTRGERSLWQWFRTTRQADLVVVFGEDAAALVGLSLALVAVLLTLATGNPLFDALGTMAIGALLVVVALFLGIEIKAMLIGQSMSPATTDDMRAFLQAREEIVKVYSLITLQLGLDAMVAVKAKMRDVDTPALLIADINRVEVALKARYPQVRWSFFEPDIAD